MGKMLGGEEKEQDPDAAKKEEERQEALRQQEEERKDKYAKMEAERERMRQGIRDKVWWPGRRRGGGVQQLRPTTHSQTICSKKIKKRERGSAMGMCLIVRHVLRGGF